MRDKAVMTQFATQPRLHVQATPFKPLFITRSEMQAASGPAPYSTERESGVRDASSSLLCENRMRSCKSGGNLLSTPC